MKKTVLLLSALLIAATSAFAVPALQIYIPGATYDAGTDTWVTPSSDFELWVVTSGLKNKPIYDLTLVASLGAGVDPSSGSLSITPMGGTGTSYTNGDFTYGTPPASDPLPGHGIFPANYVTQLVTPFTNGPFETVHDYNGGSLSGTNKYGMIFKYTVSTSYSNVHFDAFGFHEDNHGKRIFAPFSHDGEMVPEPTTLVLFGLGMGVAGYVRKRRNKDSL